MTDTTERVLKATAALILGLLAVAILAVAFVVTFSQPTVWKLAMLVILAPLAVMVWWLAVVYIAEQL